MITPEVIRDFNVQLSKWDTMLAMYNDIRSKITLPDQESEEVDVSVYSEHIDPNDSLGSGLIPIRFVLDMIVDYMVEIRLNLEAAGINVSGLVVPGS